MPARSLLLLLSVILVCAGSGTAAAQTPETDRDAERGQDTPAALRPQLVERLGTETFDLWEIAPLRPSPDGRGHHLDLIIDGRVRTAALAKYSMRAAGFRVRAQRAGGVFETLPPTPLSTYRGFLADDPAVEIAATVRDGKVHAYVMDHGRIYGVHPARDVVDDAAAGLHVTVPLDTKAVEAWACGVAEGAEAQATAPLDDDPDPADLIVCYAPILIAWDATFSLVTFTGSEFEAQAEIESVMNAVELIYATQVDMSYAIAEIILRADAETDPYSAANCPGCGDSGVLLTTLRAEWLANHTDVVRNLTHLLTASDFEDSVIGKAFRPGVCAFDGDGNDFAYGVNTRFHINQDGLPSTLTFDRLVALVSHEIGHNWNAQHCGPDGASDCGIMCAQLGGCPGDIHEFGDASVLAILDWRIDEATCLFATTPSDAFFFSRAHLVAPDANQFDSLGYSVGVTTVDGTTYAAGGAPFHDDTPDTGFIGPGAVYVFRYDPDLRIWVVETELIPPGLLDGDQFGTSLDLEGDTLVVGAPWSSTMSFLSGAVYAFELQAGVWTFRQRILAEPETDGALFGDAVTVGDDMLVAGAPFDNGDAPQGGAAYFYRYNSGSWSFWQRITPVESVTAGHFGMAVAMDVEEGFPSRLAVGAPGETAGGGKEPKLPGAGAVYLYENPGGLSWSPETTLMADDGDFEDAFGSAVAIDGDYVLVGAPLEDENGEDSGAVYVFENDGGFWSQVDKLILPHQGDSEFFGIDVTLHENVAIIGSNADNQGGEDSGAAWVYARLAGVWTFIGTLVPGNGDSTEQFAAAVDLEDTTAVVGSLAHTSPGGKKNLPIEDRGSVDIFTVSIDCDGNGFFDVCELEIDPVALDCNDNGVIDACDIANGTSMDKNGDGVPDECNDCNMNGIPDELEPDCNGNMVPDDCDIDPTDPDGDGIVIPDCNMNMVPDDCPEELDCNSNDIPDSCDIADGTSEDCNTDGIPDECQTFNDCNDNGEPDICEIVAGDAEDCNDNNVPDECDIDSGFSNDVNNNMIPDDCEDDCNGNGVPDRYEVKQGLAPDCNGNGIPDACDIVGDPPLDSDVDMDGIPDECEPDCNNNNVPDHFDIEIGLAFDCNGNGIPDECDIDNATSFDCQPDGVPDECQPDCNGNLFPDDCDIALGVSDDCDLNGLPDECDLAMGNDSDCNANDVLDGCELAAGTAFDCQPNGVLDECEFAAGTSFDINGNGIPDECDPDCQPNGLPDDIDLVVGIDMDCNGNGIPDGCDLAAGNGTDDDGNGVLDECDTDCNGNGISDITEIALGVARDCNGNGFPDECDIDPTDPDGDGTVSPDDDGNGIPDECDTDCNNNGVSDITEIALGDAPDCNGNGFPDECDIDPTDPDGNGVVSPDDDGNGNPDECDTDCNNNGISDITEIAAGLTPDCNFNGVPDSCDVASGASFDQDGNGIPDECDRDCNANGITDSTEIATGMTPDCNFNGVPDDCDIDPADPDQNGMTSADDDVNGVPDECQVDCNNNGLIDPIDIEGGFAPDCNNNNVPDECDIDDGTSLDIDGNGIPDECDEDCNQNSIPDSLEFMVGFAQDCNENGRPDDCDIATGDSLDFDGNGIPDECTPATCADSDVNGDGEVTIDDFIEVIENFGMCPAFCPWDIDNDMYVSAADMVGVLFNIGCDLGPGICPADIDDDDSVGVNDLVEIITSWGPCDDCDADLNGDGTVDVNDLVELFLQWGDCPVPDPCPGDADGDGSVTVNDLVAIISDWGPCPGCDTDTNGDGVVDVNDLVEIISGWGACPDPFGGTEGTFFIAAVVQILMNVGPCTDCTLDVNGDGILDISDVVDLAAAYGGP